MGKMRTHISSETAGEERMNEWRNMTEQAIEEKIKVYRESGGKQREDLDFQYETGCYHYFGTHDYDNGKTDTAGYKFCCEMLNYCKWYNQAWFHWVCGAVGFLILVCLVVICICCCCCGGGRGQGGKDSDHCEEDGSQSIDVMEEEKED